MDENEDIKKLYFIKGVSGAIIGRAIYDGSINLNELIVLKKKLINVTSFLETVARVKRDQRRRKLNQLND